MRRRAASMTAAPFNMVAMRMSWPGQSTKDTCLTNLNFPSGPMKESSWQKLLFRLLANDWIAYHQVIPLKNFLTCNKEALGIFHCHIWRSWRWHNPIWWWYYVPTHFWSAQSVHLTRPWPLLIFHGLHDQLCLDEKVWHFRVGSLFYRFEMLFLPILMVACRLITSGESAFNLETSYDWKSSY